MAEKPSTAEGGCVWASISGATGWVYVREVGADRVEVAVEGRSVTMTPASANALARQLRRAAQRQTARAEA